VLHFFKIKYSQNGKLNYLCFSLRIIAKKILREFWITHADAEQPLKSWFKETSKAQWNSANKIKLEYPRASILNENRMVFNIKGNRYRLIVGVNFEYKMVWIRFVGTHANYNKINANKI
jgi:mRNA interferase HigB